MMNVWNKCCSLWPIRCICKPKLQPTGIFTAIKYDYATGKMLQGAVYTLQKNGSQVAGAVSDELGRFSFFYLEPGEYELIETVPPAGYLIDQGVYTVVVAADGTVTIDGSEADGFALYGMPHL